MCCHCYVWRHVWSFGLSLPYAHLYYITLSGFTIHENVLPSKRYGSATPLLLPLNLDQLWKGEKGCSRTNNQVLVHLAEHRKSKESTNLWSSVLNELCKHIGDQHQHGNADLRNSCIKALLIAAASDLTKNGIFSINRTSFYGFEPSATHSRPLNWPLTSPVANTVGCPKVATLRRHVNARTSGNVSPDTLGPHQDKMENYQLVQCCKSLSFWKVNMTM